MYWLTYRRQELMGKYVDITYLFTRQRGLIKGAYAVPLGDDCLSLYGQFKTAIEDRYPGVTATVNTSTLDFCGGVQIGKASLVATWEFPSDSTRIYIEMGRSDARGFGVHYEGPGFDAFDEANRRREQEKNF